MSGPVHPGLKKYREAREKGRKLAILRGEIRKSNPTASDSQVEEIAKAALRAQQNSKPRTANVPSKGKGKRHHRNPVKVEVVNRIKL